MFRFCDWLIRTFTFFRISMRPFVLFVLFVIRTWKRTRLLTVVLFLFRLLTLMGSPLLVWWLGLCSLMFSFFFFFLLLLTLRKQACNESYIVAACTDPARSISQLCRHCCFCIMPNKTETDARKTIPSNSNNGYRALIIV